MWRRAISRARSALVSQNVHPAEIGGGASTPFTWR
jgi:hypothetical protein